MGKPTVFISYNYQDIHFARSLSHNLKAAGFEVWIDEGAMSAGDVLSTTIHQAIKNVTYLIAVISSSSAASEWVEQEVNMFIESKEIRNFYPVLYEKVTLPGFLKDIRCADFTDATAFSFAFGKLLHKIDPVRFPDLEFVSLEERQWLLDQFPHPAPKNFHNGKVSKLEELNYYKDNSLDIITIDAKLAWPASKLITALRELIRSAKLEVFVEGLTLLPDTKIPPGAKPIIPYFFKGGIDPGLRATDEEIEMVLRSFN